MHVSRWITTRGYGLFGIYLVYGHGIALQIHMGRYHIALLSEPLDVDTETGLHAEVDESTD